MPFNYDPSIRRMVHGVEEVIDTGWKALVHARRVKAVHISEKEIFFSGAAFIFDAILHGIGSDRDPTPEDIAVMEKVHAELVKFNTGFNVKMTGAPNR